MIGNLWPRKLGSYCIAIIVVLGVAGSSVLIGQQADSGDTTRADLQARITLRVKNLPLKTVIARIAQQARLTPMYGNAVAKSEVNVSLDVENLPVLQAFEQALKGTGLRASINGSHVLIERISSDDSVSVAQGTITGRVIDSVTRNGVRGVTISVVGMALSAVTREQGDFRIANVPAGKHSLSAKIVGYQTRTILSVVDSGSSTEVVIMLPQTTTTLSEVVTTATGQQRRVEVGNDIARIDADQIRARSPVRSVSDLLEAAQVPGVLVTRGSGEPGAPSKIRIRGIGSISQSNDPVILLDGIWIDNSVGKPSRIDDIDPATIETIEIVRGPSAATLYGQDAANGVIVITTKKGKDGPARWNFSYSRDWGQPYGTIPLAYAGFGHNPSTSASMYCPIAAVIRFDCIQDSVVVFNPNHSLLGREGSETNNAFVVQVDGGSNSIAYSISATANNTIGVRRIAPVDLIRFRTLGYATNDAYTGPSTLDRRNITSTLTLRPRNDLTLGVTVIGTQAQIKDNKYITTFGVSNIGNADRKYSLDTIGILGRTNTIQAAENPSQNSAVVLGGMGQWTPGEGWVLNGTLGFERNLNEASVYQSETRCDYGAPCVDTFGLRSELSANRTIQTVRLNISRNVSLGKLNKLLTIRPTIGGDYKRTQTSNLFFRKNQIPTGERSMTAGVVTGSSFDRISNATAGWYINSMIGVFNRVYFDIGIRQDVGSAITSGADTKYPKIGGSWLVSDEPFWRQNRFINQLRLRGAIGYSAVQPDIADIRGRYVSGYEFVDGSFVRSVDLNGTGNPRLKPERAGEIEVGIDMDFLHNRVNVVATYAHSENQNVLVIRKVPPSVGSDGTVTRKENIARIRNRNFELMTDARVLEGRNTLLVFNYGLTFSDNVVAKLGNGVLPFSSESMSRIEQGYPLGGIWARRVMGYRDINKDGLLAQGEVILSDSVAYIGWSQPRYRASYGISLTLHNRLTFDTRFAYQSNYVQQYAKDNRYGAEDVDATLLSQANALIPNVVGDRRPISDLRWNSASITYQLPEEILRLLRARQLSVSLAGSNLALWTNYVGRDPGVNSDILSSEVIRDDGETVPRPRLFVLKFRIGF